ncbi:hypothetical protein ACIQUQ_14065 [Streptomyces sp. NPDC101118]|uniref:hypothetical protein n=1 Tax=Streptomyces sp. NPDC101118 TaxID=3366109 RepID=UPI0038010B61
MKKWIAGTVLTGVALLGASPAFALSAWSPSAKAYAETFSRDTAVSLTIKTSQKAHTDYYRETDPSDPYHLWNKGAKGSTTTSGYGGKITQLRACNWIPDNDDECSRYYR